MNCADLRLDEYLDGVRALERRIYAMEQRRTLAAKGEAAKRPAEE